METTSEQHIINIFNITIECFAKRGYFHLSNGRESEHIFGYNKTQVVFYPKAIIEQMCTLKNRIWYVHRAKYNANPKEYEFWIIEIVRNEVKEYLKENDLTHIVFYSMNSRNEYEINLSNECYN